MELQALQLNIIDKYQEEIYLHKIETDSYIENRINIYYFPTDNNRWSIIKQDICFLVKQYFGDKYTTSFYQQTM